MRTLRPVEHFLHDLRSEPACSPEGQVSPPSPCCRWRLASARAARFFRSSTPSCCVRCRLPTRRSSTSRRRWSRMRSSGCFSYPVVERAAELLAGRAEVAAQSSVESVLIATRGGGVEASPPEAARLQLVAGDFFGTLRQRAQIGRLLGPDDNRTLGQHPVAVISDRYWSRRFGRSGTRAGYRADHQRRIDGDRWRCGSGVFWYDGRHARRRTSGRQQRCRPPSASPGTTIASGGDLQKPWPSQPEIRVAPSHDPGARGRRTSGGRSHDARPAP